MTDSLELMMVGLPASGKSTYVGALFHALKHEKADGFHLEVLPDQRDYLIKLERDWLSMTPVARSQHHGPKGIELTLRDELYDRSLVLSVPDIAGEEFEAAWEHGVWSDDVGTRVTAAGGILLFVRSDDVRAPAPIVTGASTDRATSWGEHVWHPHDAPTQAKLCDLLEQIGRIRGGSTPPIAVVVSAWDAVADLERTPAGWLREATPLLAQWLQCQDPDVMHAVFGISAQGGDVRRVDVRAELARHADLRPLPKGADCLTRPLQWLIDRAETS